MTMLVPNTMKHIADNYINYIYCLSLSILILTTINYFFFKSIITGLLNFQISFIFNFAIIFYGLFNSFVSIDRFLHFLLYELLVTTFIYYIYARILNDRKLIFSQLSNSSVIPITLLITVFNIFVLLMYLAFVPSDGASRIEFMTSRWFSFVRPFITISQPLGYFLTIYLLDSGKRILPVILLFSLITPSIASGSKASFAISITAAFIIYRQVKGSKIILPLKLKFLIVAVLLVLISFSLNRLQVDILDVALRFIRTAEATIIVYFSDTPTAACTDVSKFAVLHRGVARFFGDQSAIDIDTLFGYALSIVDYGAHNFTGPNSQIASYMLCNYTGLFNIIALLSIAFIFICAWYFYKLVVMRISSINNILLLPFVFGVLDAFSQSYDDGVSSLSVMILLCTIGVFMRIIYGAARKTSFNNNFSG